MGLGPPPLVASFTLFFFFLIYLFIFQLCWVFISVQGPSPVAASGGHPSPRRAGPPPSRPLLLRSTGSRRASSAVVAHGPSRSAACGILPDQGSNPRPLHWQADSQPLRHQGSPSFTLNYFLRGPISEYSHTGGVRASTYEFGEGHKYSVHNSNPPDRCQPPVPGCVASKTLEPLSIGWDLCQTELTRLPGRGQRGPDKV